MAARRLAVFMFHDVEAGPWDTGAVADPFYAVSGRAFERMLGELLVGRYRTIVCRDIPQWQTRLIPAEPVALTFDDGLTSHHDVVLPRLARHGCRATFFVPAGLLGTAGHLGPSEVRALHAAGMEIGSHGLSQALCHGHRALVKGLPEFIGHAQNRLGTDELRPMQLVPISRDQDACVQAPLLDQQRGLFRHRDAGPIQNLRVADDALRLSNFF